MTRTQGLRARSVTRNSRPRSGTRTRGSSPRAGTRTRGQGQGLEQDKDSRFEGKVNNKELDAKVMNKGSRLKSEVRNNDKRCQGQGLEQDKDSRFKGKVNNKELEAKVSNKDSSPCPRSGTRTQGQGL